MKEWVDKLGSGTTIAGPVVPVVAGRPESQAARIARLEAESALRAEQAKLAEERDILRQATGQLHTPNGCRAIIRKLSGITAALCFE